MYEIQESASAALMVSLRVCEVGSRAGAGGVAVGQKVGALSRVLRGMGLLVANSAESCKW